MKKAFEAYQAGKITKEELYRYQTLHYKLMRKSSFVIPGYTPEWNEFEKLSAKIRTVEKATLRGVTIGDQFIPRGKVRKDVHTVVDFLTVTNLAGEIVKEICVAEYKFMNQTMRVEVAFSTVLMNKLKKD